MAHETVYIPLNISGNEPQDLLGDIVRDFFIGKESRKRKYEMLYRYWGLGGQKKLTLEEIGMIYGVTRERVRQILNAAKKDIKSLLLHGNHEKWNVQINPEIMDSFRDVCDWLISLEAACSETEIVDQVAEQLSILEVNVVVLRLFLEILGFEAIHVGSDNLIIWLPEAIDASTVQTTVDMTTDFLRESVSPQYIDDIIISVNSKLPSKKRISLDDIKFALDINNDIEETKSDYFQVKFEQLRSNTDRAYRILYEHGEPLHFREILKQINKRLVQSGKQPVPSQHLYSDERLENIGRSGKWRLSEWESEEVSTKYIIPLMQEALHAAGEALTPYEIYEYVSDLRPVDKKSIYAYLSGHRSFVKVEEGWALAVWNPTPVKAKRRNSKLTLEKLTDYVVLVFKNHDTGEMPLAQLAREIQDLHEGANYNSIYNHWLSNCPAVQIVIRESDNRTQKIAIFNPNYPAHLEDRSLPIRQAIQEAARETLQQQPDRTMLLVKLRDEIVDQLNCPKASVYSAIDTMPDVDKFGERRKKFCKLKVPQQVYEEYVNQIQDTQRKKLVERAIGMLNIDYVDLGLFEFGRIFEDTLKTLLSEMENRGLLTSSPKSKVSKMRLNDLINLAQKERLVIEGAPLHHQRIHRNDRTHGIPSPEERKSLLATCPTEVPYYISYISLFEGKILKLS